MRRGLGGIVCFALALICVVGGGAALAGVSWPGFRGPNQDGTVPDARLVTGREATLKVGWKTAIGPGYSALAVGDGRVLAMFAAGDADVLAAFDVGSGKELWRHRIADTYAGHDGSHDGPISTPLLARGRVFGLGAWGHLFALDAATGEELWKIHVADDLGGKKPHYGFTTSPRLVDGVLVVEIGAEGGKAIAGLDPDSGAVRWTLGDDTIEYHSPTVVTLAGKRQVLAVGKDHLWGIDAASGRAMWSYKHAGDDRAMGGMTIVPVPAGDGRIFLMNKIDSSVMLQVTTGDGGFQVSELWSNNAIKQSYVTPVYHDGLLYGMNNRIFTCIDAATGETRWRSRHPGDGFPILVGDHLAIITKPGTLHVARASAEGYDEVTRLELFDEHAWSEPAFADGHLFARSMGQLARIDVESQGDDPAGQRGARVAGSEFGRFLAELKALGDPGARATAIDAFLARQPSFPIVEDDGTVHFVYRGEAQDVGIVGDMIGYRREDPMTRIPGTDLFHYSTRLEPDAAVSYGFIVDYGEPVADPLNSRPGQGLFGEVSWFAMPAFDLPDFLDEAPAARQGRLEPFEWTSEVREGQQRSARVYLPAGYDSDITRRYPVLYVHHGQDALDAGRMKHALDHLIGSKIQPVIAVFVIADAENPRRDMGDPEKYPAMVADELVPAIDAKYRTIAEPMARASVGSGRAANAALACAFKRPDVFRRVGAQSATVGSDTAREALKGADEQPMVIYLDWGTYHLRSPHEAWDLAEENRKVWSVLRELGYRPSGGERPEGFAWGCWSGHTDEMLAALFPRRR